MQMGRTETPSVLNLRAGEIVEVLSKNEILATLDPGGRKEGLPFMPEMLQYCGKKFRVYKRADKTCDTIGKTGSRRMENTVHLEGLRCDGGAHGGCQAGCLLFWKEAWLRSALASPTGPAGCDREALARATRAKSAIAARRPSWCGRPRRSAGGIRGSTRATSSPATCGCGIFFATCRS